MRIASQNVAKRLRSSGPALVNLLSDHRPEVIALQEVTASQVDGWCTLLVDAGYDALVRGENLSRKGGALLASRCPVEPQRLNTTADFSSRVAAGRIEGITVASVYFPTGTGAGGWTAMHHDLMQNALTRTTLLIGDFQMVVAEIEIGSGTFWRWRRDDSYVLMQDMLAHWQDAFRTLHGPSVTAYSHLHNSGALWLNDHAFVPPGLTIERCEIDWSPVELGLSDHAALVVDVSLDQRQPAGHSSVLPPG